MGTTRVSIVVQAAPSVVWEDLRHIRRHAEWMSDAESISFVGDASEGVGARFECVTRLGPLRLIDKMEVTDWQEEAVLEIRHEGLVTGVGRFELTPVAGAGGGQSTRFEWTETLRFPWWMGGPVGESAARPVLRAVWNRNLRSFAARF
ncbi:MAG: SRPBCC family protein [Acidimicrobiaceae bacterium]|nr:SRPBCC family protein [Acidimicrobiaceae bacterium]